MTDSYTGFGPRSQETPQSEPLAGKQMVQNSAGGYSFPLDDMARLHRFLVLGSSSPTYYTSARKLTKENLDVVERLLSTGRGKEVVDTVVALSQSGRAPSNDPALFALSRCCAADDAETRRYAYNALNAVARTGTHLLHFMEYVKQFRGRGRTHRRAIRQWYNDMSAEKLAYQAVKYQSRDGWSQRDVLRLARPKPVDSDHHAIYQWIVKGWDALSLPESVPAEEALGLIWAFERAKQTSEPNEISDLILQYHLPREAVPTESLNSIKVWEALLQKMPLEAMTRNLATMTKHGVLEPMSEMTKLVVHRLRSQEAIRKARLHPIKILAALTTYQAGRGIRGHATWTPLPQIIDALNDAFYLAFQSVEPTNKRIVLALDVSGSMGVGFIGQVPGLTPRVASAAMALVTAATEPNHTTMAFSHTLVPLTISPRQRLDDVFKKIDAIPMGGTDCALPMVWAMQHKVKADAFVVYTDSETWHGNIHPVQALRQYRQKMGIPAKLIVVGMVSNGFSLADPNDGGMLDIVGFDTATPQVLSEFLSDLL
jgi:60 kDa SS-A/Ro ribonucleoprotein